MEIPGYFAGDHFPGIILLFIYRYALVLWSGLGQDIYKIFTGHYPVAYHDDDLICFPADFFCSDILNNYCMNSKTGDAFLRLVEIMDDLREKCPWDKKQTVQSLRQM